MEIGCHERSIGCFAVDRWLRCQSLLKARIETTLHIHSFKIVCGKALSQKSHHTFQTPTQIILWGDSALELHLITLHFAIQKNMCIGFRSLSIRENVYVRMVIKHYLLMAAPSHHCTNGHPHAILLREIMIWISNYIHGSLWDTILIHAPILTTGWLNHLHLLMLTRWKFHFQWEAPKCLPGHLWLFP